MYIQMNSSSDFMTWKNLAKVCINHYKIYIYPFGCARIIIDISQPDNLGEL